MPTQRILRKKDIKISALTGKTHQEPTLGTLRMTVLYKGKINNLALIAKESDHFEKRIERTALRVLGNGNVSDFDSWN